VSRAGRSAQAEYERLRKRRQDRRRRYWPVIAIGTVAGFASGFFLPRVIHGALSSMLTSLVPDSEGLAEWSFMAEMSLASGAIMGVAAAVGLLRPSRSEVAWRIGAAGERRAGRTLDALHGKQVTVLHDLAMPGSRANIDHIAVTPAGVFTVDAKRYTGRLEIRSRGSHIWINGRNRSQLLDQARSQADAIESFLTHTGLSEMRVTPVLCFVDTRLPLFLPRDVAGVRVCSPRSLCKLLTPSKGHTLNEEEMERASRILADGLRPR
jgi:hypothetical protein